MYPRLAHRTPTIKSRSKIYVAGKQNTNVNWSMSLSYCGPATGNTGNSGNVILVLLPAALKPLHNCIFQGWNRRQPNG